MPARKKKPSLFIASSQEAGSIVTVLENSLKSKTDVTVWWSETLWTPGLTTLEVLLRESSAYDFAVVIFREDDLIVSRGTKSAMPRDNVLFEAGLFMSNLGPQRTFILVPKEPGVKILSDLAGVNLIYYPPPTQESGFEGALKKPLQRIKKAIDQQEVPVPPYAARCGPSGYNQALTEAGSFLERAKQHGESITVSNIALDMEHTWGVLRDSVLSNSWTGRLTWQSLMLDWQSKSATKGIGDGVTLQTARNREGALVTWCEKNGHAFSDRNISFECRAYSVPPLMHGILFNDEELYFSLLLYHSAGVSGSGYCHMQAASPDRNLRTAIAMDYIKAFKGWFRKLWEESRPVWPSSDQARAAKNRKRTAK